jgi:hypothetical protein
MLEVRDRKCRDHYGEDVWAQAKPQVVAPTSLHTLYRSVSTNPLPFTIGKSLL